MQSAWHGAWLRYSAAVSSEDVREGRTMITERCSWGHTLYVYVYADVCAYVCVYISRTLSI